MVDSGAKTCAINEEEVRGRTAFVIRPVQSNWIYLDGSPIQNVVGETTLTVKFADTIVDLPRVAVVKFMTCPLILGIDWVNASQAAVTSRNGQAIVIPRSRLLEFVLKDQQTPVTALPRLESATHSEDENSVDQPAAETPEQKKTECLIGPEEIPWGSETHGPLHHLCCLADEKHEDSEQQTSVTRPPSPETTIRIKPIQSEGIPAGFKGFVRCRVPESSNRLWMTNASRSSRAGREWISPSAILLERGGFVDVPMANLSSRKLLWSQIKTPLYVESVDEGDIQLIADDNPSVEPLGSIQEASAPEDSAPFDNVQIDSRLTPDQKQTLKSVLLRHRQLFTGQRGLTDLAEHRIETENAKPIFSHPRRVSDKERKLIGEQVSDMLKEGVIEPSTSSWCSPVVLVAKKNGDIRFCIDYRRLNAVSDRDMYPMPHVDDVIGRLDGAQYFSSVDLQSGFWQLPVAPEHRHKTAFATPDGLFQFRRLPFGLSGSPASFQRLMDKVLRNLKWIECLCYFDDVLIFGRDFQEHCDRLDRVLDAVGKAGLTLNPGKCLFGTREITYVGYTIDGQGIRPDNRKVSAITQFPRPESATQLRAFIGLASFYRKFIHRFAEIARPLHELLKKNADVRRDWSTAHQLSFETLKDRLATSPILAHDDSQSPLELQTDASGAGIGAVLTIKKDLNSHPIMYVSRRLTPAEGRYHANELECLALVWALHKLRHIIYGRQCEVKTDSNVLKWLHSKKDISGKLGRWIVTLQEFDVKISHLKGSANVVADALSRAPVGNPESTDPAELCLCAMQAGGYSPRELAILQHADPDIRRTVLRLQDAVESQNSETDPAFVLRKGILYRRNGTDRSFALVVPSILRRELIAECHDDKTSGHQGVERTLARLRTRFYWTKMERSVRVYVASCTFCQGFKPRQGFPAGKLHSIPPPREPFHTLGIDHLGPLKQTAAGNVHIIVCIDYLTRWIEAKAVQDTSAPPVIQFLEEDVFLRHGFSHRVVSDGGPAFKSHALAEFFNRCNIQHVIASAEHPETNGLCERINRSLTTALAAFIDTNHDNWDDLLPHAIFALNTAKQTTTQMSPFELVFGRQPSLKHELAFPWPSHPHERVLDRIKKVAAWRRDARLLTIRRQRKSEATINRRRKPDPIFRLGELVLVARIRKPSHYKSKKFIFRFLGPYQISRRVSATCYEVEDIPFNRSRRMYRRFNVHSSQLRRFRARAETDWDLDSDVELDPESAATPLQGAPVDEDVQHAPNGSLASAQHQEAGQIKGVTSDETEPGTSFHPTSPPEPTTRSGRRTLAKRNEDFVYY